MGFPTFKKAAGKETEERSPTPPEYDGHSQRGLSNVAREELEGLTLYEKKCVLINREIDNNGFGRYQWYIWGLCGLGYFIDLIWAQAFGLILGPLQQELGFPGMIARFCACRTCRADGYQHRRSERQHLGSSIHSSRLSDNTSLIRN